MKKYIFISPLLLCLLSLYSCYDDSSTLATNNIGNITFTEKQSELYVGSMEELTLIPDIQIAEGTNTDALTYEWALTETPVTSSSSYNFEYEIISTDPQLNYIVERPVSTSPYTLLLTITDTVHDNLQYTKYWKIYVPIGIICLIGSIVFILITPKEYKITAQMQLRNEEKGMMSELKISDNQQRDKPVERQLARFQLNPTPNHRLFSGLVRTDKCPVRHFRPPNVLLLGL
jgi:hypothetical protein